MYAVIMTGGKQYRVQKGEILLIEKINNVKIGEEVVFTEVLLFVDGKNIVIGKPVIDGVVVKGEILAQKREAKVLVFKKKAKKGYKKFQGHRQYKTELKIIELTYKDKARI
ncbi:MAG: 50S ribosomal protein L21 [Endomicrobium sp.]|jgi:large subunit ribosomal protein L21|nr:50S ribosomal protein L21 [Endomicrobium sp.]